jgi:hypothetical protein
MKHKVLRPDRYSLTTPPAAPAPPAPPVGTILRPVARIGRYKRRWWAVYDEGGELVAVCVYRKGAMEVLRRLRLVEERRAA